MSPAPKIPKWKTFLGEVLLYPKFDDYMRMLSNHRRSHHHLQERAKKGEIIEITPDNPDPKLAELGMAFEKMLEHPLCKKYLRYRLHLYTHPPQLEAGGFFEGGSARNMRSIFLPTNTENIYTQSELTIVMAHELGHLLYLGYTHPRRNLNVWEIINKEARQHRLEHFCDTVALVLSKEPASSLESFFRKSRHLTASYQKALQKYLSGPHEEMDENSRQELETFAKTELIGERTITETHPSDKQRNALNEKTYKQIQNPHGLAAVEAEMERIIEAEHRKIFPHHYSRGSHK